MKPIDEQDRKTATIITLPATIQIHGVPEFLATPRPAKRRIAMLLDHPLAQRLAWSSWMIVIVALTARLRAMAIVITVFLIVGLLIGLANGVRWLFHKN